MDLADILSILAALIFPLMFFGFLGAFLLYAFWQTKKRKRLQTELATRVMANPLNAEQPIYPVKYAAGKNFHSWLKIFPWEASGVLRLTDDAVVFQGAKNNGQPLEFAFVPQTTSSKWIGVNLINGVTSWFMLEQNGERHYFTAETGTTVFGSKHGSQEILDRVSRHFGAVAQKSQNLIS